MFNVKNILALIIASSAAGFIANLTETDFAPFIAAFISALFMLTALSFFSPVTATPSLSIRQNVSPESDREKGIVKWFDRNKGYGFITRAMGEDIFVHFRSIRGEGHRSLFEGQNVEFTIRNSDKGPQAEDIAVLK